MRSFVPGARGGAFLATVVAVLLACAVRPSPAAPRAAARAPAASEASDTERPIQVFFTGSDDGYLDACGCDDGLLGGLPRRHTLLRGLGADGEASIVLSNGRLITGSGTIDAMKLVAILFAMEEIGYDAIALTERELALGRERLAELAAFLGDECPFLATNLEDGRPPDDDAVAPLPASRSLVREVAGSEVIVLSAVATNRAATYRAADANVRVVPPAAALEAELASRGERARSIVLAQMSVEEAKELARELPALDLVIVQGPEFEDHPQDEAVEVGTTSIVTTGRKGKFVGTFRFGVRGELDEFRGEPVTDTLEKSSEVQLIVVRNYRDRLVEEDPRPIEELFEKRPTASGASYVGADEGSCASCHPEAWEIWAKSKHARAWQTLVDQDLPPGPEDKKGRLKNAIWDPDCVKCHVTGFGEVSGYAGIEKDKLREARLADVTCEACHGPAGDHAERAQRGDDSYPGGSLPHIWLADEAARDPARALAENTAADEFCQRCHDPDNSPNFSLREYWLGQIDGKQLDSIRHGKE